MPVEQPLYVLFFGCCGCTSNIIMKEAIHEVHCTIDRLCKYFNELPSK